MNCSNNRYENIVSSCGKCSNNESTDVVNNALSRRQSYGLVGYPLANVYAPVQDFEELYEIDTALVRGTIFSQLDLPFVCGGMTGGRTK